MHDHTDHYNTIGLGEVVGVINGVDFRSRHNDYLLRSPSRTSQDYRATEEIAYPDVPPAVTRKASVEKQIEEMRLWFKAWADQDASSRDYTKYFKPVLCYMEGAWTETDFGKIQEPFESERHHISAENWYDLQEKIRYTAYTGSKDKGENYAFLPTKIMDIDLETGEPIYAQWNYRILCHPLKEDLPLSQLWPNGELHFRYALKKSYSDYTKTRACRFVINKRDQDRMYRWDILESLMRQALNAGYYHRFFRTSEADAMGLSLGHRGFSDRNLYVAFTNHSDISPVSVKYCENKVCDVNTARVSYAIPLEIVYLTPLHKWNPYNIKFWVLGKGVEITSRSGNKVCDVNTARVSYAIPLEIVYLTPLHKWNPYNIKFWPKKEAKEATKDKRINEDSFFFYPNQPKKEAKEATKDKRNGGFSPSAAFNGINDRLFYQTPAEFFDSDSTEQDPADTASKVCGVLDQDGNVQNVSASGVRIFLPEIPGITGNLRTRFPIFPVHEEGSTAYKEVEALREMMMDIGENIELFKTAPPLGSDLGGNEEDEGEETRPGITLYTSESTKNTVAKHRHSVTLTYMEYVRVKVQGKAVEKVSSKDADHTHMLRVTYDKKEEKYRLFRCDKIKQCWDGHGRYLYETDTN
ncbi:hypothetical protein EGW08_004843 [Elysia chlorotica]|uniref:Uncharacterized protein n=1 Tax=Elysia chlorotica TaxID=188477 RepID=A0A3S1A087_ELYCH|nr:hypothetical protein EGW08_004843 [Elysia chlorotica]